MESTTKLPIRFAWIMLWCHCDREGRFEWRPQRLKAGIIPYDKVNFEDILNALAGAGFVVPYEVGGRKYAYIPSWRKHQLPNIKEPASDIPSPSGKIDTDNFPNEAGRNLIYERDQFTCLYCGLDMKDNSRKRCLDHVIPRSRGGSHNPKNLATACKSCNSRKAYRTPEEAGMKRPEGLGGLRCDYVNGSLTSTGPMPDMGMEGIGNGTGKEQEQEREGKKSAPQPRSEPSPARRSEPALWGKPPVQFDRQERRFVGITDAIRATWRDAYPAVDLDRELARMAAWIFANPTKGRKSNYVSFCTRWLQRSQDSIGPAAYAKPTLRDQMKDGLSEFLGRGQ